jgi:hypothetical protein
VRKQPKAQSSSQAQLKKVDEITEFVLEEIMQELIPIVHSVVEQNNKEDSISKPNDLMCSDETILQNEGETDP